MRVIKSIFLYASLAKAQGNEYDGLYYDDGYKAMSDGGYYYADDSDMYDSEYYAGYGDEYDQEYVNDGYDSYAYDKAAYDYTEDYGEHAVTENNGGNQDLSNMYEPEEGHESEEFYGDTLAPGEGEGEYDGQDPDEDENSSQSGLYDDQFPEGTFDDTNVDEPDESVDYYDELLEGTDDAQWKDTSGVTIISSVIEEDPEVWDEENDILHDEEGNPDEDEWEIDYSDEYNGVIDEYEDSLDAMVIDIDSNLANPQVKIDITLQPSQYNSADNDVIKAAEDQFMSEEFPEDTMFFDENDKGTMGMTYVDDSNDYTHDTHEPSANAIATCEATSDKSFNEACVFRRGRKRNKRNKRRPTKKKSGAKKKLRYI